MNRSLLNLSEQHKIFVFVGSGGIGKTTTAAAWAMELAALGHKVAVITIDPSRRLGQEFGMNVQEDSLRTLAVGSGELDVHLLHAEEIIATFMESYLDKKKIEEFQKSQLFRQITTNLSQNQSVSTVYKLAQIIDSKIYDYVVIDTPPSGHTVDFFLSPDKVVSLFRDNFFMKILENGSGKISVTKNIFLKVLQILVGKELVVEMEKFFGFFQELQKKISDSAMTLKQTLKSTSTYYFMVTSPDKIRNKESVDMALLLKQEKIPVSHILVNRSEPFWVAEGALASKHELELRIEKTFLDMRESVADQWKKYDPNTRVNFIPETHYYDLQKTAMEQVREFLKAQSY